MQSWKIGLGILLLLPGFGTIGTPYPVSPTAAPAVQEEFDLRTRLAVRRGLDWLAKEQRENGSWTCRIGYKLYESYNGEEGEHVGITALACMAFIGDGHVPGRGKYGHVVERGLNFVLRSVREEDGYVTSNGTRMYTHAFAALFLAEVYGMSRRVDVKSKLKQAVNLLVVSQNREGGWRYSPTPVDADLSVTVSCLQALRAARNVGIIVPIKTIHRATEYVRRCHTRGGFRYQATNEYAINDARITFPLTACGLVSMHSAGKYSSEEVRTGVPALLGMWRQMHKGRYHYFYGHYYASQALYISGGTHWSAYYDRVKREILDTQSTHLRQQPDGGWVDDVGRTYATAMACIILQIPTEMLPIFQR